MTATLFSYGYHWIQSKSAFVDSAHCMGDKEDINSHIPAHNSLSSEQGQHENFNDLCISLNDLLVKYASHNSGMASSGGIQQLVNKSQPQMQQIPTDGLTLQRLPHSIQLHILSFLNAKELCTLSQVSKHLENISSDELLWRDLLDRDMRKWTVTGHTTFPNTYRECNSDWSNKEIYLRCSPGIHDLFRAGTSNFHNLSTLLRSILPKKTPKLAMFGPGLESRTSAIVRKILENQSGLFSVHGMFPGQFEGVGSGFMIKMRSGTGFNLVTLYTSTKKERENITEENRLQHNRLLDHHIDSTDRTHVEVRPAVRDLCRTLDGFIFVIDVTKNSKTASSAKRELKAMLNEMWAEPDVPLLVVAAVQNQCYPVNRQVMDVAEDLQLEQLNRPWQVRFCDVETLDGLSDSVEWVVHSGRSH